MLPSLFLLGIAVSLLLVGGCANPVVSQTYSIYLGQGHRALDRGDLAGAEQAYYRALVNTRIGRLSDESVAVALYNLGRVKRFLCKDDEAEQLLRDSIEVGEKSASPDFGSPGFSMSQPYFELARLYYDQQRYKETVERMERAWPIVEKLGVEKTFPAVYAYTLEQYADALRKIDREHEAELVDAKVKSLRASHPDLSREWEVQQWEYIRECKTQKK
ncbi:MAG: hypothetical protein ACXW1W_12050 [Methylococcaceae bacterium]